MPVPKGNRYGVDNGGGGGRPSKFRPDTVKRAREFVDDHIGWISELLNSYLLIKVSIEDLTSLSGSQHA